MSASADAVCAVQECDSNMRATVRISPTNMRSCVTETVHRSLCELNVWAMHNVHARQYAVCRRRAPCAIELCGYILSAATEKTIITLNDRAEQKKNIRTNRHSNNNNNNGDAKRKLLHFIVFVQPCKGEWGQRARMRESHAYEMFIWIKNSKGEKRKMPRASNTQHYKTN